MPVDTVAAGGAHAAPDDARVRSEAVPSASGSSASGPSESQHSNALRGYTDQFEVLRLPRPHTPPA